MKRQWTLTIVANAAQVLALAGGIAVVSCSVGCSFEIRARAPGMEIEARGRPSAIDLNLCDYEVVAEDGRAFPIEDCDGDGDCECVMVDGRRFDVRPEDVQPLLAPPGGADWTDGSPWNGAIQLADLLELQESTKLGSSADFGGATAEELIELAGLQKLQTGTTLSSDLNLEINHLDMQTQRIDFTFGWSTKLSLPDARAYPLLDAEKLVLPSLHPGSASYLQVRLTGDIGEVARFLHASGLDILRIKSDDFGEVTMHMGSQHATITFESPAGTFDLVAE